MRTIQIADDVYAALQRMAVPFEEDINDVLRRLLRDRRASNGNSNGATRASLNVETHHEGVEGNARGETVADAPMSDTVVVHRRSAVNEQHLPQSTFRTAVLGVLRASRSPVDVADVLTGVERQLGDRMSDGDLATSSGDIRWHIQTRNALAQLMHEGTVVQWPNERYQYRNGHH